MARYGLANEYWKLGEHESVVEHLTAYLEKTDDQGAGYRMLGQALHKLNRVDEARNAYQTGRAAAERHGHPSMAAELDELAWQLDD